MLPGWMKPAAEHGLVRYMLQQRHVMSTDHSSRDTSILLVRHGETAWNRQRIFRGVKDVPLNETGRRQARLLAPLLREFQPEVAYTSPLSRARQTAELALTAAETAAIEEPALLDFDYGQWGGLEESVVATRWPELLAEWNRNPADVRPPGGDTLEEVSRRAFAGMEAIAARHAGSKVALFAHRVVNKLLLLAALGMELERFPFIMQENACVNRLVRTPAGYVVYTLNDTCHLRARGVQTLQEDF